MSAIIIKPYKSDLQLFSRFGEHNVYNQKLHLITIFSQANFQQKEKFLRLVLNFNFRHISFSKKKALPFFLALELITNQKCVVTLSSKNIFAWKLRKNMLVGCKVSLRNKNLYDFLDTMFLAFPRMQKIKSFALKNSANFFKFFVSELIFFYVLELALGLKVDIKSLEFNFIFQTSSIEEKNYLLSVNKIPLATSFI